MLLYYSRSHSWYHFFMPYISGLHDDVESNISISADNSIFYSKLYCHFDWWKDLELTSKLESHLRGTAHWGRKLLGTFSVWKLELFHSDNSGAIVVKMNGFVLNEESSFKKLGFSISSNVDWALCIVTITKTACTKMWVLIRFVFCSAEFWFGTVALYLFRYTTQFCMENCCHFWTGAPDC